MQTFRQTERQQIHMYSHTDDRYFETTNKYSQKGKHFTRDDKHTYSQTDR